MLQNKHVFQLLIILLSTHSTEDAFVGVGRVRWLHQSPMKSHVRPWALPGKGGGRQWRARAGGAAWVLQPAGNFVKVLRDPLNRKGLLSFQVLFSRK